MPEAVVIRSAIRTDLPGLVSLFDPRCDLELMLKTGRGRILIASVANGTMVGMCSGRLTIQTAEGGPAVLIEDVVVREDWRGQGLGELLIHGLTGGPGPKTRGGECSPQRRTRSGFPDFENNAHRPDNGL